MFCVTRIIGLVQSLPVARLVQTAVRTAAIVKAPYAMFSLLCFVLVEEMATILEQLGAQAVSSGRHWCCNVKC
jgi:hypothetical protein